jgi:hypothetical protein
MTARDPSNWPTLLERTLRRYDEELLRRVVGRLLRPRNFWPREELISRCVATTSDVTIIERRLKDLEPGERRLLALIGHSRQPRWRLGNLIELMLALGEQDGPRPVFSLLDAGFLFPWLPEVLQESSQSPKLKNFEQWMKFAEPAGLFVFAHPLAIERAVGADTGLEPPASVQISGPVLESDGLSWPLRLAVLWQQAASAPFRRTQQGGFFKRDLDRLDNDPLLNTPPDEGLPAIPDAAHLAVPLALEMGLLEDQDGDVGVSSFSHDWDEGLLALLASLWQALPMLRDWNPLEGQRTGEPIGNPFPSACLLALVLLSQLPEDQWTTPETLHEWVTAHHPFWTEDTRPSRRGDWMSAFLLGLAYQLRMVQAARTGEEGWAVRLSPVGRHLMGLAGLPPDLPAFPRTLLVQPNLEIVAYRQGLTTPLIAFLARIATWQSIGSVCLLQLGPDSVYRALESGLTFEVVLQTLEKHSTRPTPPAVIDSLRTWADKRDRITIYPSAALLEFGTKEDLDAALARGFPGVRLAERLAVVASEASIDYTLFRLTSSRDYASRPEQCVEVGEDGVTLTVDLARSDLLLESELARFAESIDKPSSNGRRRYRLTPATLGAGRSAGVNTPTLEAWFQQRTGQSISPAALLLLTAGEEAARLRSVLVLNINSVELADGLMQWPATRELIAERLGPTTLSVAEVNVAALREQLRLLGMSITEKADT